MSAAQWWVLWIGANELVAGLLYCYQRQWWLGLGWMAYAVACVGLALGAK